MLNGGPDVPVLAIEIGLNPNLVALGPVALSWHGVFSALGILAGVALSLKLARRAGLDMDGAEFVAFTGIGAGLVGARLFYVVEHWGDFEGELPGILRLTEGGITLYGGLLGGLLGGLVVALARGLPILRLLDIAAPGMILGQALGRVGDLINGEHLGTASSLPWTVRYTHPETLGELGRAVHPTAGGYEPLGDLLILALVVFGAIRWARQPGLVFSLYLIAYSVLRASLSPLRMDESDVTGIAVPQVIGVLLALAGAGLLLWVLRAERETPGLAPG